MARLKEMAVGRGGDTYFFDPAEIFELDGYNVRDMNSQETQAHIRSMADAIKQGGTASFPPITIGQIDGKIYVYSGYCRRRAFLIAREEGAPIKGILAVANTQNDEERIVDLLTSNNGLPLTPIEKAKAVKRLLMFSWTVLEISKRLGVSVSSVNNLISLINAPVEIRDMVQDGEISATTAIIELRRGKNKAKETLIDAVSKAKKTGSSRATSRHINGMNVSLKKWKTLYHAAREYVNLMQDDKGNLDVRIGGILDALVEIDGGIYNDTM